MHAEDSGDLVGDEPFIGDRRELDEPGAIRLAVERLMAYLEHQSCFASATNAHERDEPIGRQELLQLSDFSGAADERRSERWQVREGERPEPQSREISRHPRCVELEYRLGDVEILEQVTA